MPKHKLDAAFCLTAQCRGKRRTDYYDTTVTGFVLECRASGGKTYYLRYQDQHGVPVQFKIAAYGDISFDKAKKEAIRLRSEVVLGSSPAEKKAEKKAVPLYGELADQHLEHARTYVKSIKTVEGYMKRIRSRWAKVRLTDIRQQDVAKWLAELRESGLAPATVEKTRVIFNRSFELGARWGVAGCDKNPVRGVPRPRFDNARQMYVNSTEAERLLSAAAKSRNKQAGAVIAMLLLTGMRVSELLSSRWEHVDTSGRTLFVPTSKNGRSRHIPLSQDALDTVAKLTRPDGAIFLFPNARDPKKHLTTIKHAWETIRIEAKLPDLHLHDLRHSFASAAVAAGIDLFHVGKILGHKNHASTMRYAHIANDTLLAAVEAGAKRLKVRA